MVADVVTPAAATQQLSPFDYSEGCSRIRVGLIQEDIMSKENNKQKPNANDAPRAKAQGF
jgi:hypothetical protein